MTDLIDRSPEGSEQTARARSCWLGPVAIAVAPWLWFAVRLVGPQLDLFAVLLPGVCLVGIVSCVLVGTLGSRPWFGAAAISIAAFAAIAVLLPRIPDPSAAPVDPFLLVSANTFQDNPSPDAAALSLVGRQPDVLVAVETPVKVRRALGRSLGGYSHEVGGRINVYSRWPQTRLPGLPGVPASVALRVEVRRPGAPFVLVAAHLPNPLHEVSFSDHFALIERLLAEVAGGDLPVVIAGDLNTSDRTAAYRELTRAMRDAMRSNWAGRTYVAGLFGLLELRIDHVLEPRAWCSSGATTFALPGSDHRGLSVRLGTCPPGSF